MPPADSVASLASRPGLARGELAALKIDRSRRKARPLWLTLLFALLAAGVLAAAGGAGYWALSDRIFPPPTVKLDSVRVMTMGQARTELTATGYLESRWQAAVGAKVPGRISRIPVEEGDKVQAGDVLAELEHSDLDAMLASRKVAVASAEAQFHEARVNLLQAERDLARERAAYRARAVTDATVERAETVQLAAQAILAAREAAVSSAKAAVVEAEEAIRNMFIYAPFDGTVVTKDAEQGESIMPGGMGASSGRGSVITLAKLDELEVDTDVKEDYLSQLRQGQPAQVTVDAVPDHPYRGKLREIIPMGDRTRGIVKVKVSILDPDDRLFPELSATVNFLPDETAESQPETARQKRVFAPESAVAGAGEERSVWIFSDGRVRRVSVNTVGEPRDGLVEISAGLSGGEQVVVDPPAELEEGGEALPAK